MYAIVYSAYLYFYIHLSVPVSGCEIKKHAYS